MKTLLLLAVGMTMSVSAVAGPIPDSLYRLYATHEFDRADELLEQLLETTTKPADRFEVTLEQADFLLDKRNDYAAAEDSYRRLLDEQANERVRPDILYRLALALELQGNYPDAAKNYETVATRYMESRFGEDALDAIERCFRKNYQDRVAYINDYPITRIELDDRISRYPSRYEEFEQKQSLLDTMIDNRLLMRAALDAGVPDAPGFAEQYWNMRNRYVFEQWQNRNVTAHAEPTERELRAWYRQQRDSRFTTPEQVQARQLVVRDRMLADSLRRVLLSKDDIEWDSMVTRFSIAPDQERGGDLGRFSRGMRDEVIERTAFRSKPGQISRPVSLHDTAWALIYVTDRTPKSVTPFDEARDRMIPLVRQEKAEELYEKRIEELKTGTDIFVDTTAFETGTDTIAIIDNVIVTSNDLNRRLEQIPVFFRSQFQTPEGMRRILDQMVMEQLIITDAEANHDWLANNVVDRVLERRAQMLVDHYSRMMTAEQVAVDSTEVRKAYQANIEAYRVPTRVRASEIVALTRARTQLLHRWVTDGRLPELITGRAILVGDPDKSDVAEQFLNVENPDSLTAEHGFTGTPQAIVPDTPVIRIGNRLIPDMGQRGLIAGPFAESGAYGMGFNNLSRSDTIFLPTLSEATDPEQLSDILGIEVEREEDIVLAEERLGTYVRFAEPLAAAEYRRLFNVADDTSPLPLAIKDGELWIRVTHTDSAGPVEFSDIARRFSTAPSRHSGGDMAWFERDDKNRDSRIIDAAFRLRIGDISPVMQIGDSSWTFVKLEEKEPEHVRDFVEVKPELEAELRTRKIQDLRKQLITDLRSEADIRVEMKPEDFIFESFDEDWPDLDDPESPDNNTEN